MVSTIAQLRTGHCPLNKYAHKFRLKETPYCDCGYGQETVQHFLLECPRFKEQRNELRRRARAGGMRLDYLLGDPGMIRYTMEYIKSTGRFDRLGVG